MAFTPEYWIENKDRILASRRERYATDPAYAKKAREKSKEYRDRKRRELEGTSQEILIDGSKVAGFNVDEAMEVTGVTRNKLRHYHQHGYLPEVLRNKPRRLYTNNQLVWIKRLSEFVRDNRGVLRRTTTADGMAMQASLDELIETLKSQWKK